MARWTPWAERAALAAILAAVAVVTVHPHWNVLTGATYPLPVHMDTYVHWGRAQAAMEQGTVHYRDPFRYVEDAGEFSLSQHLHERGFHAYVGSLQALTGIPWAVLLVALPTATALLLSLALYALARQWGAGLETALWAAAIPSSLRFLGPAFAVPIAFALPLVVAGLIALFQLRGPARAALVAAFAAALWPIHTMGALALLLLALLYAVAESARRPLTAFAISAAVMIPFLLAWPYVSDALQGGVDVETMLPAQPETVRMIGVGALLFAAVGLLAFPLAAERGERVAGAALGVGLVGAAAIILARNVGGVDVFRLYDRTITVFSLLTVILAGYGLAQARIRLAALARPRRLALVAVVAVVALQVASVGASARAQMEQDYYRIVSPEQMADYERAAQLLEPFHHRALVDGLSTMPFTIATGRPTYFVATPGGGQPPAEVRDFFARGANDTAFLLESGTTVVVTEQRVDNPDLVQLTPRVWVLREDYARLVARATGCPSC